MLDWEEHVFVGLKAIHRKIFLRPEEKRRTAVRVTLKEKRGELLLLAQMLAGRAVTLFESSDRVLHRDDRIFLPPEFSRANTREGNARFYELKTILAALALRAPEAHPGPLQDLITRHSTELPHLEARFIELRAALPELLDILSVFGLPVNIQNSSAASAPMRPPREPDSAQSEFLTEINGEGRVAVSVREQPEDDGPGSELPIHTFEKIETLEEYTGHSRTTDSEDELTEHAEALEALSMTSLMRTPERPRSIYRSDLILDGLGLELGDSGPAIGRPYPEWDYKRRAYRTDWCYVRENTVQNLEPTWNARTAVKHRLLIQRLRRQFSQLVSERARTKRQPSGLEFDLDAVVHAEVRRRTGGTPDENIYQDTQRKPHDLATLILLDESFSTDSYLDNQRILDLITETVFCVGEVLHDSIGHFAVAAFSSNTRRACRFSMVKDFEQPWATASARLGALAPRGYTRIGPALRHAQERLAEIKANRHLTILVTDGRPCDYDRYEGSYGIHDVRKAIEVGRLNGIQTHAFAIEKRAAEYFPQMLSPRQFDILSKPSRLADTMCSLFSRILE